MNTFPQSKPLPKVHLSEEKDRELLKGATSYVYRTEPGFELVAHCFSPENNNPAELKPAILFLHGGLWDVSIPTQFAPHCMHLASRGMIAITAEYRTSNKYHTSAEDAFYDAQMAMLWLKHNHAALGIDPNRITVAGAASGAHMALSLAILPEAIEMGGYDSRPLAAIGLSSLVNTTKKGVELQRFSDPKQAAKNSPSNNVRKNLPPILLVHGKADTIAPYEHVAKFAKMMQRKKNTCEFIDFEAMNHSFFNFNISPKHFEITLNSIDAFLTHLGCLEPTEYL